MSTPPVPREQFLVISAMGRSPMALVALPALLVAATAEAALKLGSAIVRTVGTLTITTVAAVGGGLIGLLALSPRSGRHAVTRLHALAPHLRRRLRHLVDRIGAASSEAVSSSRHARGGKHLKASDPFPQSTRDAPLVDHAHKGMVPVVNAVPVHMVA